MSACSHARTPTQVRLCQCCELPVDIVDLKKATVLIALVAVPNSIAAKVTQLVATLR